MFVLGGLLSSSSTCGGSEPGRDFRFRPCLTLLHVWQVSADPLQDVMTLWDSCPKARPSVLPQQSPGLSALTGSKELWASAVAPQADLGLFSHDENLEERSLAVLR